MKTEQEITKLINQKYIANRTADGKKANAKTYREKNKEKLRIYQLGWVARNREHYLDYQANYRKQYQEDDG